MAFDTAAAALAPCTTTSITVIGTDGNFRAATAKQSCKAAPEALVIMAIPRGNIGNARLRDSSK
jgi:hypothetical protein